MPSDLNNVSYVTLTLIGQGGASPQDLVEMHRSAAQIYYAWQPPASTPSRSGSRSSVT